MGLGERFTVQLRRARANRTMLFCLAGSEPDPPLLPCGSTFVIRVAIDLKVIVDAPDAQSLCRGWVFSFLS
jgi:hypothetical protein